ncbi:MAG TPA: four helix bundle protein [Sedimentisphaerales bacterium]|nr:four helix bundle protein [Sedimentisphaerales bacterium]
MKVKDYKDLNVWQKGIEIVDKIYSMAAKFPKEEVYGLVVQMRKAAVSIPSNIAEGFVRRHSKEYKQFLYISLGSCAELDTQVIISHRRGYITKKELEELTEDINHETRMLVSLINKIQQVTGHE